MADLGYGDPYDSDDLEGNDDDIGALGSILSWDDDDDNAGAPEADVAGAVAGKSGQSSLPPGLVSFSLARDANGQLYFPQTTTNAATNAQGQNVNGTTATNQASGLTLPLPTPINFAQEKEQAAQQQQAQQQAAAAQQQAPPQQQQQAPPQQQQQPQAVVVATQQQQPQQQQLIQPSTQMITVQTPQGLQQLPANFAALFQQNGVLLQQQQQQPAVAKAPQAQPQQQQQQQQPLAIRPNPAMPGLVIQQQQVQPQQVQQVQQQVQQVQQQAQQVQVQQQAQQQVQQVQQQLQQQFQVPGDANAFLRQLQVAQIQQQFNALQQQGGLAAGSLNAAQQQALQQQLQQLQRAAQMQVVAAPAQQQQAQQPQQAQPPVAVAVAPPPQAVAAIAPPKPKAPPKTTTSKAKRKKPSPLGVVSASDTDGESRTKAKKTAAELIANPKKRKPPEPIDTSNMTPQERAKANRDRNREHARNTRLRKKAYLEKLKATVDELCKERDTLVSERAGAANLLVEMHNTRTEVLMSFFALRSTNEKRRKLWASILDESCFACVMPVTPYRSFPASEVQVSKCQRTVLGIDGMMADTASLHVLLSSLVDRSKFPHGKIEFCYTLVTEEAVVAGNQMMARWVMTTLNAVQCGARMEVAKQGMLCCKFNSAHRITGLELMFDVMALMLQLKQAAGSESFSVIPNTVQTCQRAFDKPMVMTLAEGPYTIVQVNQLWENMTGYKAEEVVGKTSCSVLQGATTDKNSLHELMNEVRFKRAASVMLVNYTKSGERFRNCIVVFPLGTDSRITHYLALTSYVERLDGDGSADATANGAVIAQPAPVASTAGFNGAPAMAPASAPAGQITPVIQNTSAAQAQATAQAQVALANAANAAMMAQGGVPMVQAPGMQGQMLPPANTGMIQQQFQVQNVAQPQPPQPQQQVQQVDGSAALPVAQV